MIETPEQAYQAIEKMGRMPRILESYGNDLLSGNSKDFAILAEGPMEQLRQLQEQANKHIEMMEENYLRADILGISLADNEKSLFIPLSVAENSEVLKTWLKDDVT